MGGATFEPAALARIVEASGRYPYFIQEFGKAIWEAAPETPFTEADAELAVVTGRGQLDAGFFLSRWGRATKKEKTYLRAMAQDGDDGSSTSRVAEGLATKFTSLGPTRAQVISKGLIYSPEYGKFAFTVPGMSAFIQRQHDQLTQPRPSQDRWSRMLLPRSNVQPVERFVPATPEVGDSPGNTIGEQGRGCQSEIITPEYHAAPCGVMLGVVSEGQGPCRFPFVAAATFGPGLPVASAQGGRGEYGRARHTTS